MDSGDTEGGIHHNWVDQINEGEIEKNYLFVTTAEFISVFKNLINDDRYDFQSLDGYWLVFRKNSGVAASYFDTDPKQKHAIDSAVNLPEQIVFSNGIIHSQRVVIPIWGEGWVDSNPIELKKGNYQIRFEAFGTIVNGELPKMEMAVNKKLIAEFAIGLQPENFQTTYSIASDTLIIVSIRINNDVDIPGKGDRNAFAEKFEFVRIRKEK